MSWSPQGPVFLEVSLAGDLQQHTCQTALSTVLSQCCDDMQTGAVASTVCVKETDESRRNHSFYQFWQKMSSWRLVGNFQFFSSSYLAQSSLATEWRQHAWVMMAVVHPAAKCWSSQSRMAATHQPFPSILKSKWDLVWMTSQVTVQWVGELPLHLATRR